jgi:putative membrane protein
MLGDWSAVGDQAAREGVWTFLGMAGPLICGALLAVFLVRAVIRHRRYRVVGSFSEEDERAVRQAVVEAERKTIGEIVPVVVERSDPHPGADWLAALAFVLVGSALLVVWLPWEHPAWVLVGQVAIGAVGFALARLLPDFKRVFIFEDRATEVAGEQAFQEFYRNGLHRTEAATGVLLFVTLLERRVIVLADEGIDGRVDAGFWAGTSDLVLEGIRTGSLRDGLIAGVRRTGEVLARDFPWIEGDRNEIPDRVIVRKQ